MSLRLRWSIAAASILVACLVLAISWNLGVRSGRRVERRIADNEIATIKDNARESVRNALAVQDFLSRPILSDKANQLLTAAASDDRARCYLSGTVIHVGGMTFGTDSRPREAAEWREALEGLIREGMLERRFSPLAGGREEYLVSKAGFDYVEQLNPNATLMRRPSDGVPTDATLAEFFLLSREQQDSFIYKAAEETTPRISANSGPKSIERNKASVAAIIERKLAAFRNHADKLRTDYQKTDSSIEAKRLMGVGMKHEFRSLRVK